MMPPTSSEEKTITDHVVTAARAMVRRALVFLIPGARGTFASWVGSGILVRSPKGRPFILTAAHNLDEVAEHGLRAGHSDMWTALSCVQTIYRHPDRDVDVGLIVPVPELAEQFAARAVNLQMIAGSPDLKEHDWLYVAGFPAAYTEHEPRAQLFASLTYGCFAAQPPFDDRGRLRIEWTEGEWPGEDHARPMPDPGGMSGGALWRFRPVHNEQLWTPENAARLIGVQSAWDMKNTLLVEPVSRWTDWLHGTLEHIDR